METRPAIAGYVRLGRTSIGQASASTVELALAGAVRVTRQPNDWLIQCAPGRGKEHDGELAALMDGVGLGLRLSELRADHLAAFWSQVHRQAVSQGYWRRWPKGRTAKGRKLVATIAGLQDSWASERPTAGEVRRLLPWLVLLGGDSEARQSCAGEDLRMLSEFASAFNRAGAELRVRADETMANSSNMWGGLPPGTASSGL